MCCVMTKKLMHMNMHVAPASSSLHLDDATIGMDIPLMKLYDIASPPYKAIADLLPERFTEFVAAGANLQHARRYNNVIRKAILPVELQDVCIPVLHLDLGIYPWIYGALCADAHQIDIALSKCMFLAADDGDSAAFTALINAYKNVHDTATQQLHLQSEAQIILSQLQFVTLQERTRHSNTTTTPTVRSTKHS